MASLLRRRFLIGICLISGLGYGVARGEEDQTKTPQAVALPSDQASAFLFAWFAFLPAHRHAHNRQPSDVRPYLPLGPEHEKYLDQVLAYWEWSSAKITRFTAQIQQFDYDAP